MKVFPESAGWPMKQKVLYLNCREGISAPLLLAALLDTGLSVEELRQQLQLLSVPPFDLSAERILFSGFQGMRCHIVKKSEQWSSFSFATALALLKTAPLPALVRSKSVSVIQRLSGAEGRLSSTRGFPDMVSPGLAFLEVVGVLSVLAMVGVDQLYASVLPLNEALPSAAHLPLSQLNPLSLEILSQTPALWQPSSQSTALVTPVAAALLAELASFEDPVMTIAQTGSGFTAEPETSPARLSIYLGLRSAPATPADGMDVDQVTVIETHIDTMSGELLGALLDRLLEAGALDVGYSPLQMKKNRPGTRLTVICQDAAGERLALLLLRETNTLGVRMQQVQRRKAQRRQERIETPLGPMLVKLKSLGGQLISVAPEYEECLRVAKQFDLPLADVYEVARTAAQSLIIDKKGYQNFTEE